MCIRLARWIGSALLACAMLVATCIGALADGSKLLAINNDHIAIQGYDTVAYFTDGKAIKGSDTFEYTWNDAKWHFASSAHRDLFATDPDRYVPQFGGYCSGAVVEGILVPADPAAWAIVDGKLYMAADKAGIIAWKENAAAYIKKADEVWPELQNHPAAQY